MDKIQFEFSVKQTEALDALANPATEEVCYGGAKNGGKSVLLCRWAFLQAKAIIDYLSLKPSNIPPPVGFLGRKRGVDFGDTTLETWKKFVPAELYTIKEQAKELIILDTVKICFGGLDDEENIKKFNSAEYVFIGIDQAEECDRNDVAMLRATLYRFNKALSNSFYKFLFTANPADCFLIDDFQPEHPELRPVNRAFIQALPADNEFIDCKKYVAQLREAFKHAPELVAAYVDGVWSTMQDAKFVIPSDMIEAAQKVKRVWAYDKILVTCDPAWTGEKTDEIVIYVLKNAKIIDSKFLFDKSTIETAGEIVKFVNQYNAKMVTIDSIGIGAGVYDNVVALSKDKKDVRVIAVNSATRPEATEHQEAYANLRAAMWWEAGKQFGNNEIMLNGDDELARELKAVKYEIKNGKILIEDKKEIKKRINRSPDRADAFIQGLYYLPKCPISYKDRQFTEQSEPEHTGRRAY